MQRFLSDADIARLRASGLCDPEWYLQHYPDVARLPLDPVAHFARIGAALGRDPGPRFSTRYYLAANPDVAAAGLNPLLHYISSGRTEGRAPHPGAAPPPADDMQTGIGDLRRLLETGGLSDGPRTALEQLATDRSAPEQAALAAEVLAFWALNQGETETALQWFEQCAHAGGARRLAPLHLMAAARARDLPLARKIAAAAPDSPGLHLARCWISPEDDQRVACLNQALAATGLAPVACTAGSAPLMDRLHAPADGGHMSNGPLISMLMAVHNSAATVDTAIRAVLAQRWQAFELVVIDDASTDTTVDVVREAANGDPRLRLIPLPQNRGAYGARNAGLAEARGAFVTLHDADDWSHPDRLLHQMTYLRDNPGHVGCLSQQVRCTADLRVSRWTGAGDLVFENLTSLLLPTRLVRDMLGGWDTVRVSADSELLRRVRQLFGQRAVTALDTGPLALQRDSATSATADSATGMGWFYYGARQEYFEAQQHHHAHAPHLRYGPETPRPFPAPHILQAGSGRTEEQRLDRVYAGILTGGAAGMDSLLDWLDDDRAAGRSVGLVPLYATGMPMGNGLALHPTLRQLVNGDRLRVLCYGERARCRIFRRLPGQSITEPHRYLPLVHEEERRVLAPGTVPG